MSLAECGSCGADPSGALFTRVDLEPISKGRDFEGASLHMVDAAGAVLIGAQAARAQFEHVKHSHADLSEADLRKVLFDACTLKVAIMDTALLQDGRLVYSNCREASFRGTILSHLASIDSAFANANLNEAREFSSPEIVMEMLRLEAGGDFELAKAIGAICIDRERCYAAWRRYLATNQSNRTSGSTRLRPLPSIRLPGGPSRGATTVLNTDVSF
jgi:hypothetical protein